MCLEELSEKKIKNRPIKYLKKNENMCLEEQRLPTIVMQFKNRK